MKIKIISIIILVFIVLLPASAYANNSDYLGDEFIPKWVKDVVDWWVQGEISDDEFMDAMEFLVKHKIIYIESDFSVSTQQQIASLELKQKTQLVSTIMNLRIEVVEFLSELSEIQSFSILLSSEYSYLQTDDQFLKENVLNKFQKFTKTSMVIDQVRILNLSGMEILRLDSDIDGPFIVPDSQLQDKSDRYYFQKSLELGPNDVFVSKIDLNMENGQIEIPYKPTFRVSTMIHNSSDEFVGIFIVNYKFDEILQNIPDSNFCNIVIFEHDGNIVHHYDKIYEFGNQTGTNHSYFDAHPEMKQIIAEKISWYVDEAHNMNMGVETLTYGPDDDSHQHFACEMKLVE